MFTLTDNEKFLRQYLVREYPDLAWNMEELVSSGAIKYMLIGFQAGRRNRDAELRTIFMKESNRIFHKPENRIEIAFKSNIIDDLVLNWPYMRDEKRVSPPEGTK